MTAKNEKNETRLVANRELYKRGKVAYNVGDPVPANAYPPHQINALISNGGLRLTLVNAVPPKGEASAHTSDPEIAGMYVSPHDVPAVETPKAAPKKSRKAKAG